MIHKQRFFAEAGYQPLIYGYGRVSHKDQLKGNSIPDQEARLQAYIQMRKLDEDGPFKGAKWEGMFAEPLAQSALTRPFRNRHMGRRLIELMRPGDHILVDKLDRFTRSAEDFFSMDRYFCERGIRLHILNLGGASLDSGTACGRVMLGVLVLSAEFESLLKGERVRDARARLRAAKKHSGVGFPIWCELVGSEGGKKRGGGGHLVLKPWAIPLMEKIKYLKEVEGLGKFTIAKAICLDRASPPEVMQMRPETFLNMYWFHEAWNAAHRPDINELKFLEFIAKYKQERKANG
jgi:DNA invertase Pin-like site-specific DNA recombinase